MQSSELMAVEVAAAMVDGSRGSTMRSLDVSIITNTKSRPNTIVIRSLVMSATVRLDGSRDCNRQA